MAQPPPAQLKDGSTSRVLRVRVDRSGCGLHLARSIALSGSLTCIHQKELEHTLHHTLHGRSILACENPLLTPAARENLDATGLIRPGVMITDDTILASILDTIESNVGKPNGGDRSVRRVTTGTMGYFFAVDRSVFADDSTATKRKDGSPGSVAHYGARAFTRFIRHVGDPC